MKTLYVIGNGFDLHHDIKSAYKDYRIWLEKNHSALLREIDSVYTNSHNDSWWNQFEENLGYPELKASIENALLFAQQERADKFERDLYVDDENGKEFIDIDLGELVQKIENTFHDWVVSMNRPNPLKKIKMDLDDSLCITFNYSNTLEDLYHANNVVHLHGQVKRDGSGEAFVLGHGTNKECIFSNIEDEFNVPWNANMDPKEYTILNSTSDEDRMVRTEAAQKILLLKKDADGIIEQNIKLFEGLRDVERVLIYGLSFGEVDVKYLDKIISSVKTDAFYIISYFSDEDIVRIKNFASSRKIEYKTVRLKNLCTNPIVRLYLNLKSCLSMI